mgnify:CR=1 FL=1
MTYDLEKAKFNLAMTQIHPNWYDHLDKVEAAMRQSDADWAVRAEYGWDGDDGVLYRIAKHILGSPFH